MSRERSISVPARVITLVYIGATVELAIVCAERTEGWVAVVTSSAFVLIAAIACVAMFKRAAFRYLRTAAFSHALASLVALYPILEEASWYGRQTVPNLPLFVLLNLPLPLIVGWVAHRQIRQPQILDLIYGEEGETERSRRFSFGEIVMMTVGGLGAVTLVLLGGPFGQLILALYVAPVLAGGILLYFLFRSIFRERREREDRPMISARRMNLSSKMGKRSRIRHHYTVSADPPGDSYRDE